MADLLTKEHYDLMAQFEREHSGRFDKEDKALWLKGIIYQDGRLNELFLAYRRGYAFCEADMRSDIQNLEASRDGYRADAEHLAAALAQQDADKVDAERYRWLRDPKKDVALVLDKRTGYVPEDEQIPGVGGYHTYEYRAGVELDAAIDSARKEQE